jgi:hypothetical protein
MTVHDGSAGLSATAHNTFRVIAAVFAFLLATQCVWLLLTEFTRSHISQLPVDKASAASAANYRTAASWAALFGVIRGDLWAESAFTQADVLWADNAEGNSSPSEAVAEARATINRALDDGPHQSGAWLFLADLASRFHSVGSAPSEALKMSYYTGASNQRLMPLRLRIGAQLTDFNDIEIRQLVARDVRLLLAGKQTAEIADAYGHASPAAKSFIEQTIQDIEPSAVDKVLAGVRKQNFPE